MKLSVIISDKHGIYAGIYMEFPHELPNNARCRILGDQEMSRTSQNFIELKPSV